MNFVTDQPVEVRLDGIARAALGGLPDSDIPLYGASIEDGWLLADYREQDGSIRRYAIPSEHVIYARQLQQPSTAPAPQARG